MPFTLSHPAAILPFHKLLGRRVSISAMAIGSMAPDFAYFLPGIRGQQTHSLLGILSFCLPAGLLVYLIFHLLIKRPASLLLPAFISTRLRASVFGVPALPQVSSWIVAWSLMLGAGTHIAWDSLTHRNSAVVNHVDFLRMVVFSSDGYDWYLYKLLQHISTAVGLLVLAWWIKGWLGRKPVSTAAAVTAAAETNDTNGLELRPSTKVYITACIIAAGAASCAAAGLSHPPTPLERWLFFVVVAGLSGFMLALLFYCVAWTLFARRRESKT
ncbi:DUF4184 family protein [Undibacterium sp.]|uniref:DUF4184 family protein n=1 Tax=Undibacterium sp. TaxID=1914977 RepID=UPI00374D6772